MVGLVRTLFAIGRAIGPEPSSEIGGWWARRIGRLLPQHRIALANARAAFPDKSADEIAAIVGGAWENLGRTGAEYAHLSEISTATMPGRGDASSLSASSTWPRCGMTASPA